MKYIFFNSLFFLSFLITNVYTQWPDIGDKWYYSYSPCSIDGGCQGDKELIQFTVVKDTTVKDTNCKILLVEHKDVNNNITNLGNEYLFNNQGKIYLYHHRKFNQIYDFTAKKGDTIVLNLGSNSELFDKLHEDLTSEYVDSSNRKYIIKEVDSIMIGTKYYNTFKYQGVDLPDGNGSITNFQFFDTNNIIIENLGSTKFLLGDMFSMIEYDRYGDIRCYESNEMSYSQFPSCDTVYVVGGELTISIEHPRIDIYPNPTTGKVIIELPDGDDNKVLILKDITGKKIWEKAQFPDNSYELDLSNFNNGIFILTVKDNNYVTSYKIIKN